MNLESTPSVHRDVVLPPSSRNSNKSRVQRSSDLDTTDPFRVSRDFVEILKKITELLIVVLRRVGMIIVVVDQGTGVRTTREDWYEKIKSCTDPIL